MTTNLTAPPTSVHLVSLGCARNEVDSEELAARLAAGGFTLVSEPTLADAVVVNTCGFVASAKKDSVDTLLAAADLKAGDPEAGGPIDGEAGGRAQAVVAVGCLAERYGAELAEALPEADAVLGFDDYPDVAAKLRGILAGERHVAHAPADRRALLPLAPPNRPARAGATPGHGAPLRGRDDELPAGLAPVSGPRPLRRRLGTGPSAPVKIASGCDRRCTFCAIPAFRGAYLSRPVAEVVSEVRWMVDQGVREAFLVSENSSSYGKDLGDLRLLERLLGELSQVAGLPWVRVSYLQPAEMRPSLIAAMTGTPQVVPYFDLSFQHAAPSVLRRMRRFGDPDAFLHLLDQVRSAAPAAGVRSNVICGFPGETEADLDVLVDFLQAARLDAIGVFGYSDEDGTPAARLDGQLPAEEVDRRQAYLTDLVDELVNQRAEERIGSMVEVLVEEVADDEVVGRAAHQGPEVDGGVRLEGSLARVGDLVTAVVTSCDGVDLVAKVSL